MVPVCSSEKTKQKKSFYTLRKDLLLEVQVLVLECSVIEFIHGNIKSCINHLIAVHWSYITLPEEYVKAAVIEILLTI